MPQKTAQQLIEERATAITNYRNLSMKIQNENRVATPAESDELNRYDTQATALKQEYNVQLQAEQRDERMRQAEAELDRNAGGRTTVRELPSDTQNRLRSIVDWNSMTNDEHKRRFHLHNNRRLRAPKQLATQQYVDRFSFNLVPDQFKAQYLEEIGEYNSSTTLQSEDDVRAGYLRPSLQFMEGLLKNVDDQTWIWRNSRVIMVPKAEALGIRKMVTKMSTWKKGTELSNANDNLDTALGFGKKSLFPSYFTGAARISRDLIRTSLIDIESLVYSEFARDLGYVIEQEDITGDGNGGPLGVMVASTDGISTGRDVSTNTTTTTFKAEAFHDAKYNMKVQYRQRARWMFHRLIIRDIMKLRSDSGAGAGTGDFLMQPAIRAGEPDTLLGLPIDENEFFPYAKTASAYYGLLALWEYYVHAIALDMEILRLDQTRAATNEIEYVARVKLDGMPILEEAFTRLQFAAS